MNARRCIDVSVFFFCQGFRSRALGPRGGLFSLDWTSKLWSRCGVVAKRNRGRKAGPLGVERRARLDWRERKRAALPRSAPSEKKRSGRERSLLWPLWPKKKKLFLISLLSLLFSFSLSLLLLLFTLRSNAIQVAVQLPMFNERAVCQAIIDSACEMAWPRERFCVQVRLMF